MRYADLRMRKAEIAAKFDEIVAFSEVEKFIDTPVKRYSSGMYVRLAFAVAAHLEPEILLVDEVLAVGDIAFQRKCLGKMGDVAKSGRTVLFVSHNLAAIQELCGKAMVIEGGRLHCIDEAMKACDTYIRFAGGGSVASSHIKGRMFEVSGIRIDGEDGRLPSPRRRATISIPVHFARPCSDPHVHVFIQTTEGETVFGLGSGELSGECTYSEAQDFVFEFKVMELPLLPGTYRLTLKVRSCNLGVNEMIHSAFTFAVGMVPVYGLAPLSRYWHGLVVVNASLQVSVSR